MPRRALGLSFVRAVARGFLTAAVSPILCTLAIALSDAAISTAQAQTISSFTVQDQSDPNADTDYPKKSHWVHNLTETHSSLAAHAHFTSALRFGTKKSPASTIGKTSRFTITISVADILHCGWKLRLSGRRLGYYLNNKAINSDTGASHGELLAVTDGWSAGPSSGSLHLPEWDSGPQKRYKTISIPAQYSNATLSGTGSQTVTLSLAWDTYVSSDPYIDTKTGKRVGPEGYVSLGADDHPDNGYFLDVELQACQSGRLPYANASSIPQTLFVAANGSCCVNATVRDTLGNPMPSVPVVANFSACNVTFCAKQAAGVTIDPVAKTATCNTNAAGVAKFCVCGDFPASCTATLSADGVLLGNATAVRCPSTPGLTDGHAVTDNQYRIVFDTNVTSASATNVSNYSLTSFGTVNSAIMDGSAAVILTVSGTGLSHGQQETVTVNGVVSSPDGIAMTTPNGVTFLAGALSVAEVRAPNPDSLAGAPCVDYSRYAGPAGTGGARVTIRGIATVGSGGLYYIQDESGGLRSGIQVFSPSESLVAGHRYTAAGAVEMLLGSPELSDLIFLRDEGVGSLPAPMKQPLNVLLDPTCDASRSQPMSHDFEGALVRVDSVLVTEDANALGDFTIAGPYGVYSCAIRVVNDLANSGLVPASGQLVRVNGILVRAWDQLEIHPRSAGDITVLGVPGPDNCWDGRFAGAGGADQAVDALATDASGSVYLGGDFTSAGGISAPHVARWDGSQWSALGTGTDGPVYAMVWAGNVLYVGGNFTTAGGASANHIARWDGGTWSALGSGTDGNVYALALDGAGNLYVGGVFAHADGISASCIAKLNLDTNGWSALGTGMGTDGYIQPGVSAIQVDPSNSNLAYVGGSFGQAGGITANYVARWDAGTSTWSTLGTGMNGYVYALAMSGSDLYAAGGFTTASGGSANNVARWSTSSPGTWIPLGSGLTSHDGVGTLALDGAGRLFAGGQITAAGGKPASNIAMWAGTQWFGLGTGLDANVGRLAVDASSGVFAGGQFTTAGGAPSNHFAHLATACAVADIGIVFQDDLDGPAGLDIVGTTPEIGGSAWTNGGLQFGQFHFAAAGGAQDAGPNSRTTNSYVSSTLTSPFVLSSLGPGQILHLRVTMANISGAPSTNPFESSRVDLVANTSGGIIGLGELGTGRNWGANSGMGDALASAVTTAQSGQFTLDLYLDPNDVFADGAQLNAIVTVNGGCRIGGVIEGLSTGTSISAVRLVRNVDDEVLFDNLTLETIAPPTWSSMLFQDDLDGPTGASIVDTSPETGGAAWTESGLSADQFHFAGSSGVQDTGPNGLNASVTSALLSPFGLSSLSVGEVLHLHITMANIAASPVANPFESSRVDLITNTSGGLIGLGELGTGHSWGANSAMGNPISSGLTTGQSGSFVLDLYLDPNDALGDGNDGNAIVTLNGGPVIRGTITDLSSGTTVTAVRLVRNVDDEVFFDDLFLERACLPTAIRLAVSDQQRVVVDRAIAYPNPFENETGVSFRLAASGPVDATVHDVAGRLMQTIHAGQLAEGLHHLTWDGLDTEGHRAKPGIYFLQIRMTSQVLTRKVVRVR